MKIFLIKIKLLIVITAFLFLIKLIFYKESPKNYYLGEEIDFQKLSLVIKDTWEKEYLK
jgi:hypothetical protein